MRVYILLFNAGTDNEGIHTVQIGDRNKVLMFEEEDDAVRYAMLLEAQDFPEAAVEEISLEEVEEFCREAGYDWEIVEGGQLAIPPEENVEKTDWNPEGEPSPTEATDEEDLSTEELDQIRRKLEGLL
jgi:hypothetical protein